MKLRSIIGKFLIIISSALLFSCISSANSSNQDIIVETLDNGIPVFILKNSSSEVQTLNLFFKDQISYSTQYPEGIEYMTLRLMSHGSENYSWEDVQSIIYQKSSSVGGFVASHELSGFSLSTLEKYYNDIYDLFKDEILNPSWDENEFTKVKDGMLLSRTQSEQDPFTKATLSLDDIYFAEHPYQMDIQGTLESISLIELNDLKEYYNNILVADRMFFVAVGDFNSKRLINDLNKDFGQIESSDIEKSELPEIGMLSQETINKEVFADSPGVAYVRANFDLPDRDSGDYFAVTIAFSILNDLLFEIVRTQNSACYSVGIKQYGAEDSYGSMSVYKTQVPNEVFAMLDESISILASGKALSTTPDNGERYVDIDEVLDFHKAQYITKYYSTQQTNGSIASMIATSYLYYGDPGAYKSLTDKWNNVTKEDVVRVINEYLVNQNKEWIVLGGADMM